MNPQADLLKEQINLVDLIRDYIPLKKVGSRHIGLCPFHEEKTPSFGVNEAGQFYKCFGCGKGGDVFTFVMEHDGLKFPEALQTLSERYGIALPESPEQPLQPRYSVFELAEGERFRLGLTWRLERNLELCKLRFWNEGEPSTLADLIAVLTLHCDAAQGWSRHHCARVTSELKERIPQLVESCLNEANELEQQCARFRAILGQVGSPWAM